MDAIPLFKGEAMLLSWGDTSSRGKTVTFALHEDDCGQTHPFRDLGTGKHGQRFQIVAVPIDDDGEPLPEAVTVTSASTTDGERPSIAADDGSPPRAKVEPSASGGWYGLKPSARASILIKDEDFRHWAEDRFELLPMTEEDADDWLKAKVDTHSKACLNPDHNPHHAAALRKFNAIEREYRVSRGLETERR